MRFQVVKEAAVAVAEADTFSLVQKVMNSLL